MAFRNSQFNKYGFQEKLAKIFICLDKDTKWLEYKETLNPLVKQKYYV